MNERIGQLAEQAGHTPLEPRTFADDLNEIFLQKFAELIVYECMDLALGSSHREDDMGAIIANKIKQHFGVKE